MNQTQETQAQAGTEAAESEPMDAVPFDAFDWASIVYDYRAMRRYGVVASESRDMIVRRFKREFERRLNRVTQGIDKV